MGIIASTPVSANGDPSTTPQTNPWDSFRPQPTGAQQDAFGNTVTPNLGSVTGAAGAPAYVDQYGNVQNTGHTLGEVGSAAAPHDLGTGFNEEVGYGAGQVFAQERENQAVNAQNVGLSNNEGDVAQRDAARKAVMGQYANFNPNAQGANLNSQYDQGLNNSLAIARRQMGGTGNAGSQQANAGIGGIVASSNAGRLNAQADLQGKQAQTLGALGQTEGQTLQQSLQERGYNLQQATTLANLLEEQAKTQYNWLNGIEAAKAGAAANPSGLDKAIGYGLGAVGAAGSLAGGLNAGTTVNYLGGGSAGNSAGSPYSGIGSYV